MSAFALRQLSDFMASGAFASMRDAMERYKKECKLRKQLYNQLIELRGNIRVFCRVRPLFGKEVEEEEDPVTPGSIHSAWHGWYKYPFSYIDENYVAPFQVRREEGEEGDYDDY